MGFWAVKVDQVTRDIPPIAGWRVLGDKHVDPFDQAKVQAMDGNCWSLPGFRQTRSIEGMSPWSLCPHGAYGAFENAAIPNTTHAWPELSKASAPAILNSLWSLRYGFSTVTEPFTEYARQEIAF